MLIVMEQREDAKVVAEEILKQSEELPEVAESFEDLSRGAQLLVEHLVHRIIESGFTAQSRLDEDTLKAIYQEKVNPKQAAKRIKRATKRIRAWGKRTGEENERMQKELVPEHLRDIIRPKNLALWKEATVFL